MPIGALVNAGAIALGTGIGLLLRMGLQERYKKSIMQALGLAVIFLGLKMAWASQNSLVVVLSLALGTFVGELGRLEDKLTEFGTWLAKAVGSRFGDIGQGFVNATLLYCVGAMGIVGSLQEGLTGDASVIFAKSLIDGTIAIVLTASLGLGVMLSAVPVFLYQGAITLAAGVLAAFMTEPMLTEINGTGGLLIVGIGFNMLELLHIRLASLLPSLLFTVALVWLDWF